ncbi:Kynureninase (L-kynurenine hydrolase) [Elasticomyces elasticus]|uniref:Kynureninase n=1 Tax=Exophiala sideris TaxID=1016849 RepID=A0ABR0IWQ6_9EURO|nr:Kynureninase (L-kynurenine hydrolase) [Elasticomyces elasticus]KAK5021734.1 Kynureninase (L-kynurenine hydrolase) [Exophiala sideris]KAK5025109.1 Kynureninase (L-kynurenine hydrolase) [Exophiala sideris]KAK5050166.1 Kynureninase (L-kynurenine hydrolase) [Exophiala sideris]KAK5176914.1 Kynureninase (L-kynurenine hydrolase) [Eurotiomycetes sp. CCFEE 6388]
MAPGILQETYNPTTVSDQTFAGKHSFPNDADSEEYARSLDSADPLRGFREKFIIPSKASLKRKSLSAVKGDEDGIYFCGNSLGLQPKCMSRYIQAQLDTWASIGVAGHFTELEESPLKPWQSMADSAAEQSCRLVGALSGEVAIANTLTVNLHLLMASFYRPTQTRNKILLEWKAFPSDHYAIESQISWHGYDPKEAMILVQPDEDHIISTRKIMSTIDEYADEIALVLLPGVQYYSGQFLDISRITEYAHSKGLTIGWDLAHAAGNVPLKLHDWGVDFAAWCTYKYMNAGPGAIAGLFVHEKHGKVEYPNGADTPVFRHRLTGWYSGDKASRFNMDNKFRPIPGAGGFQISNPSAIDLTSLCASLSVFEETSMEELRKKSLKMTAYLQHLLLKDDPERPFRIITPLDPSKRGAQLCLLLDSGLLDCVSAELQKAGIVVDQRKPGVIRVAPVPLYNSYHDVWAFAQVFRNAVGMK